MIGKGRKSSRAVSFILALCMLVQMLPAMSLTDFVAYAAAPITLSFNNSNLPTNTIKGATIANDGWEINETETSQNVYDMLDNSQGNQVFQGDGLKFNLASETSEVYWQLAFDFNAETAGNYDLSMAICELGGYSNILSIYIKNGSEAQATYLGKIDGTSATSSSWFEIKPAPSFKEVYLSEGVNTLIIKSDTCGSRNYYLLRSATFKQAGAADDPVVEISAVDSSVNLFVGKYMHTKLSSTVDGTAVDLASTEYKPTVKVKDSSIATASIVTPGDRDAYSGAFLKIEGLKTGSTEVTVTDSSGTADVTIPVTVSVVPTPASGQVIDLAACAWESAALGDYGWCLDSDVMATSEANGFRTYTGDFATVRMNAGDTAANANQFVAFKFTLKEDGVYTPTVIFNQVANHGAVVDVYIDGNKVGMVDFKHPSNPWSDTVTNTGAKLVFDELPLDKGEHTLKFVRTNADTSRHNLMYITSVILEKPVEIGNNFTLIPETSVAKLEKGETFRIELSSKFNGEAVDLEGKLNVSSDDGDVAQATVAHESGKSFVEIEAVGEGIANIELTTQQGEDTASCTVSVLVTEELELELHTQEPGTIGLGIESLLPITGTLGGLVADLSGADISASSGNENVLSAKVVRKDGNIYVETFSFEEGEATIEISVDLGEKHAELNIPVTVSKDVAVTGMYSINFKWAVSPEDATIEEHGFNINFDDTTPAVVARTANWKINAGTGFNADFQYAGEAVVFDFEIPADGYYDVSVMGMHLQMYGILAGYYIDDEFIGSFNYSSPDDAGEAVEKTIDMNCLYLTKGKHKLKVERLNGGDYRHCYIYMYGINFTPTPIMPTIAGIKIANDKTSLAIGDVIDLGAQVIMTNGKAYNFGTAGENGLVLTSLNDVLSLSGSTATAKTAGIGRVKAVATVNGETAEAEYNVTVNNGKTINFGSTSIKKPDQATLEENGWRVNKDQTSKAIYTLADRLANYEVQSTMVKAILGQNEILALDFEIESDGAYAMSAIIGQVGNFGATVAAYIDGKYMGELVFHHPSKNESLSTYNVAYSMNSVELSKGIHTLQLKRINGGSYRYEYLFLQSVSLESVGKAPVFKEIKVDVDSNLKVTETYKAEIAVMMSNNRPFLFGPLYDGSADTKNFMGEVKSSNTDIFTIDAQGNITPKSAGTADIIVTATIDGKLHTRTVPITVEHEFVITVDPEVMEIERGIDDVAVLSALYDNQPADMSKVGEISAVVANDNIVDVMVVRNGNEVTLQFSAKNTGATYVRVSTSYEGTATEIDIPVTVMIPRGEAKSLKLDFTDGIATSPDSATYMINGWELNKDLTSPKISGRGNWDLQKGGSGFIADIAYDETIAINFRVPTTGDYAAQVELNQVGNFGATVAYYVDGVYIGQSSFSHPSDSSDDSVQNHFVPVTLNSLPLRAGRHLLEIKRINTGTYRHSYMYLRFIEFEYLSEPAEFDRVEIAADKSVMSVGESTPYTTEAIMINRFTDGSVEERPYRFESANAFTFANDNSAAVTVDSANGKLLAKAVGTANLQASATVGDVTHTGELAVEVDNLSLANLDVSIPGKYIFIGETVALDIIPSVTNGRRVSLGDVALTVNNKSTDVISISGTNITGTGEGTATVEVTAKLNGVPVTETISFQVMKNGINEIILSAIPRVIPVTHEGTQIKVYGEKFNGDDVSLADAPVEFINNSPDIINLTESGYVTPIKEGTATVTAKVTVDGDVLTGKIEIIVGEGKTSSSYYTPEKIKAVRENAEKYTWARSTKNSYVATAEKYLDKEEFLWSQITTQELPRSASVGFRWDPEQDYCHYCNVNLNTVQGWKFDIFNAPWKVQCSNCRRLFPSNDFWSFYQLGIRENGGDWSYQQAHERNAELVASGHDGYLKNTAYPEMDEHWDEEKGEMVNVGVHNWGVDDGYGYPSGEYYYGKGDLLMERTHTYIARYNHMIFQAGGIHTVIRNLANAYVYSGDERFGRLGAILVDRYADVYPDMYTGAHFPNFPNSDSTMPRGKEVGCIWAYSNANYMTLAYDAFYPMMEDPKVIDFLSKKAEKYNMINPKDSAEAIRQNNEDGILREIYDACLRGDINGNFGMHQGSAVCAAVVLDTLPETKEMIDWAFKTGNDNFNQSTDSKYADGSVIVTEGGNVMQTIINGIERDGGTAESAPNYDRIWTNTINGIMDYLDGYEKYQAADLYKNPFMVKQMKSLYPLTLNRKTTAAVGDSGATADAEIMISQTAQIKLFRNTGDIEAAQMIYFLNGNTTKGLHYDEFTENPTRLQQEVQAIIDEYGEYDYDRSQLAPTYGFGIMRSGSWYGKGTTSELNTQNSFWMLFSKTGSHGHHDMLNLGITAYGIDMAPDLGYPYSADGGDEYLYWGHSTVGHNTVVVNDAKQPKIQNAADPMHFDDADKVKVMDVDASNTYNSTDVYRRTVVMVEVSDDVSYGVDFFRVKGGDEHLYSFHSQSDEVSDYGGFKYVEQPGGSYQGAAIPFKARGYASGFSYFRDIRKARYPKTGEFFVDFKVKDFRNLVNDSGNLHLRMDMLNDFELSEITIATAEPPQKYGNPKEIEYVFARRSGNNLDTLFTTVYQPYDGTPYLEEMSAVTVERADGKSIAADEAVKAVKVKHKGGRIDYVIYAADNTVEYVVKDSYGEEGNEIEIEIPFCGFVGVCTTKEGSNVAEYSYVCDGTKIGDVEAKAAYTGSVVDFERDLVFNNTITVKFDGEVNLEEIVGRYIRIENSSSNNAFYEIKGAVPGESDTVVLSVGETLIETVRDATDVDNMEYTYNIAPRQWFSIPLSKYDDNAPEFAPAEPGRATAGSKYTKTISAKAAEGKSLTYTAVSLPRGATFDAQAGVLSWTPDNNQVGTHTIAIMASDGTLSDTLIFEVEVYRETGSVSDKTETGGDSSGNESGSGTQSGSQTPSGDGSGSGSGSSSGSGSGASGGGGGGSSSGGGSDSGASDNAGANTGNTDGGTGVPDGPNSPTEKFVDLGNHTWAKDAIYSLVDTGVVNGTSENTYSPAANIKRADFAIMLVRAFGITEGESEHFADVDTSKYYAKELLLAKANGIVGGVGDNKFNPEGEITRQDMMVMLARALEAQGKELDEVDESVLAQFADAAQISDYAKSAVASVVKAGIIAGSNGRINPLAKATRAEIAVMLSRVLGNQK